MRFFKIFALVGLLFASLASCGSSDKDRNLLTVSIEPQRYLLERIVGDKWQVNTLAPNGTDPENFDPPMSALAKASGSTAYFKTGHLAFEDAVVPTVMNGRNDDVVDCSVGIDLMIGSHGGHDSDHIHSSQEADPHVWGSVRNSLVMAENMLNAMKRIDPDNSEYYQKNFDGLKTDLDSLDNQIRNNLRGKERVAFMVWHPSLSYFARDYGLKQIALGFDNKEISASEFKNKIASARNSGASVFVVQPEYAGQRSTDIAAQTGVEVLKVNLAGYDWLEDLKTISEKL
ncbi:MAG: zinc ABC transporter substrate-binding protein [Bacteroides sp.]|nr:zinc ABC transporter substrate-binding protein [Bacteroides sp.]MCM1413102.1 zinc ABC transporter substrate-binding protein [Bacteroides sp.]MCM1472156.1 zinc ABC transporter substrate-binding protein [Bacteroides sp.]